MERLFKFEDFENYRVTKSGKIFSINAGIFLQPILRKKKYLVVSLYKPDKLNCYTKPIHRIVCKRFHHNPENKPEVNHLDGNKLNNNDSNLAWATRLENREHAKSLNLFRKGIKKTKYKTRKTAAKVYDTVSGIIYLSIREAAINNNIKEYKLRYWLSGTHTNKSTLKLYKP